MIQPRIDWFRVFADLARVGYPLRVVAATLGIPYKTLHDWSSSRTDPRYGSGEALVALWCSVLTRSRDELPREPARSLSAARAKA